MNTKLTSICIALLLCCTPAFAQEETRPTNSEPWTVGILLFDGYELLDVAGPLEIFAYGGRKLNVITVSKDGGEVTSAQPFKSIADHSFEDCPKIDILMVPGGRGVNDAQKDEETLDWLRAQADEAHWVTSVCTGSALLAEAGLLDGYKATTNKQAYGIISERYDNVDWVAAARWVEDRDRITSSGVTAGIDMALRIIERALSTRDAERIANATEHIWNRDPDNDPFAKE